MIKFLKQLNWIIIKSTKIYFYYDSNESHESQIFKPTMLIKLNFQKAQAKTPTGY